MQQLWIKTLLAILILFFTSLSFAEENESVGITTEECQVIEINYSNASNQFLQLAIAMANQLETSSKHKKFKATLAANIATLQNDKSYPIIKAIYKSLKEKAPDSVQSFLKQMKDQVDSMSTRVDQWKASNTTLTNNNSCRDYYGCLLGTKTTCTGS